jgi:hypothetical protein
MGETPPSLFNFTFFVDFNAEPHFLLKNFVNDFDRK